MRPYDGTELVVTRVEFVETFEVEATVAGTDFEPGEERVLELEEAVVENATVDEEELGADEDAIEEALPDLTADKDEEDSEVVDSDSVEVTATVVEVSPVGTTEKDEAVTACKRCCDKGEDEGEEVAELPNESVEGDNLDFGCVVLLSDKRKGGRRLGCTASLVDAILEFWGGDYQVSFFFFRLEDR